MDYNINLGVGGADTPIMHNVTGCLLFTRTEAYVSSTFTHIRVKGQAQISGNYFYTAAGIDATSHIGVDIYAPSNGTQVTGNYFFRVPTLVNVQASANTTFIAHNTTEDDATSLAAAPVVDAGTGTRIALNGGDRNFGEVRSDTGVFWSSVASPGFYAGANKLKVITATQGSAAAVNYIDVVNSATGSPPILRPLGTDTDIDLELLAKGAGKIRFGTRASTVDVAITGYITIKDAAGTERKLAIID
jgi:hypothetical protein